MGITSHLPQNGQNPPHHGEQILTETEQKILFYRVNTNGGISIEKPK